VKIGLMIRYFGLDGFKKRQSMAPHDTWTQAFFEINTAIKTV